MYRVILLKHYKKSLKKIERSGKNVLEQIEKTVSILALDGTLPPYYRDHQLKGEFVGYRECHIQGDLLLIYKIEQDTLVLILLNIGSHSNIFG